MALDFPVGTDFPANGDQIPDGHEHEGFYWDASAGVWKRICEREKIGDCLNDDIGETVCDRLDAIQQDIIELEEEIDAIATSVGRGTYEWAAGVASFQDDLPEAQFYMVEVDDSGNVVGITEDYAKAGKFVFHEKDLEGNLHTFDASLEDDILMMFDRPDPDFFEGTVTTVAEGTNADSTKYYIIDVTHATSQGSPTDNADLEGKYKARLNIFEAPTGGDAGEFVKKIGDTMTGPLNIDRGTGQTDSEGRLTLIGSRSSTTNSAATVKFLNGKDVVQVGYLTFHSFGGNTWFGFNRDVDLTNHGLHSVKQIRMQPGAYIGSGTKGRIIIGDGDNNNAGVAIQRPGENKRTFSIAGKPKDSGTSVDTFFFAYANSGSDGDAINYTGKITAPDHIANKRYVDTADTSTKDYVDAKIEELLAKIEELEMAGGATKNYQFRMLNKYSGGSTLGSYMVANQIMSVRSGDDSWYGGDTESLSFERRTIYLCLEDGYQLNSGRMYVAEEEGSYNQGYKRDSKFGAAVISDVQKAPPEVSNGKNIYQAHIQIDGLLNDPGTNYPPSWNNSVYLYITFADGAITEVP